MCRAATRSACPSAQAGVDQQAVAVLHQPMPGEAQLRFLAFTLAVEPGIRIGGRSMGVVRALMRTREATG
jgi:hypothetical protein